MLRKLQCVHQPPELWVECSCRFTWSGVGLRFCICNCCWCPWTVSSIPRERGLWHWLPVLGVTPETRTGRAHHSVGAACLLGTETHLTPLLWVWCPPAQLHASSQLRTPCFTVSGGGGSLSYSGDRVLVLTASRRCDRCQRWRVPNQFFPWGIL